MVFKNEYVDLRRSGHFESLPFVPLPFSRRQALEASRTEWVNVPALINFNAPERAGIWQYIFSSGNPYCVWLDSALAKTEVLFSGQHKAYAILALQQASHICEQEPKIYTAPDGGVVIEHHIDTEVLTLLIEEPFGLILRSSDEFQIRAEFDLTPRAINQILARYILELRLISTVAGA